ncbi:MAG: hypothetical protein Q7S66_05025 [bacterium]|nr:hypothetical protein [bacterium]
MTKKTLFLLALAIPLITLGAGCAKPDVNEQNNQVKQPTAEELAETRDGPPGDSINGANPQFVFFKIKELGVVLQIPVIYKDDLAYKIELDTPNKSEGVAFLYSKSMVVKDTNCGAGSIGAISRGAKLDRNEGGERALNKDVDVKIGSVYVSIEGPQDLCTGDKELRKALTDRITALRNALSTVGLYEEIK